MRAINMKAIAMGAGLLILTLSPISSRAELVIAGSFETPILGNAGSQHIAPGSGDLFGWTVSGSTGVTLLGNTPANHGVQCLSLDNLTSNSISQDITTVLGEEYTFSIAFKSGEDSSIASGSVDVKDGLTSLLSHALNTSSTAWSTYSGNFIATSTTTTIQLSGYFNLSANNLIVDAVGVSVAAVPEPGSLVLCGLAGGFLAVVGRRRIRRNRAAA